MKSLLQKSGATAALAVSMFVATKADSQTVDFSFQVVSGVAAVTADAKVHIVEGVAAVNADQRWAMIGPCSSRPTFRIEIVEGVRAVNADLKVEIVTGIRAVNADKRVCLSHASQNSEEVLRKLRVVE